MIAINRLSNDADDENRPPDHILDWCRNLVATIADGGVWGIPRSLIAFRVDKKARKLILVTGENSNPDFIATKRVFKHIGWDVVESE